MKNSTCAVRGKTASPHRNGKANPRARSRATEVNGKPNPDSPLTPEESARKFDILEAIDAIPVKVLPSSLKPLTRRMMDHAGYGQGLCWASHDTLGSETGCSGRIVRKQIPRVIELGFFVLAGRRGTTGRSRPQFAVGPRLIRYLHDYFAWKDAKKVARENGQKVDRLRVNMKPRKPGRVDPTCSGRVDPTCSGRVDPTCSGRVDPLRVNNPSSSTGPKNRVDEPPGRPDVRPETAPSVPAGEKFGGTIPLSPPSVPDDDPATTAAMWARGLDHLVRESRIAAEGGAP